MTKDRLNTDPYFTGNPHEVMKWFDPYNVQHIHAWAVLQKTGMWPECFITPDRPLCHLWQVMIQSKMADAWLNYMLDAEEQ